MNTLKDKGKLGRYFKLKKEEDILLITSLQDNVIVTNIEKKHLPAILKQLKLDTQTQFIFNIKSDSSLLEDLNKLKKDKIKIAIDERKVKLIHLTHGQILTPFSMINLNEILELYKEYTTFYGPYKRKDNRKHIILYNEKTFKRATVSYPKALIELSNNEILDENLTVDHIDRDFNNNDIDNLKVISKSEHSTLDVKRRIIHDIQCSFCGVTFNPSRQQLECNKNSKKLAGPFCSRKCSGKYGTDIQNNRAKRKKYKNIKTTQYRLSKI